MAAAAAADLFNGERIVVFLFVSCILFSVPLSLSYEAVGICLLAVAGFILEIAAERCPNSLDRFKMRRGASSGIFLSTVTMPAVMLSRLIQLARALSNHTVGAEDFVYMKMQYWTVSMSCLGVLISIYCILSYTYNSDGSSSLLKLQSLKFSMIYVGLYIGVCYTSFVTDSSMGLLVAMKILWFILHGLACAGLIWHLVHTFPTCVSIGEALLVSSGLVLYYGDMTAYTLVKISPSLLSSKTGFLYYEQRNEISTIIQGLLLGLLLLPLFYKFLLKFEAQIKSSTRSGSQVVEGAGKNYIATSVLFYVSLVVLLTVLAPLWMQYVQDFKIHPLLWVLEFVLTEPSKRLLLCIYWVSIICICVMRFYNVSKHSKIERILLRKYYHLVAVAMFSPAVIFQPKFLDLAFGAALVVFLVLEMIRVWEICPLGKIIDQFMNAFTDHRDSDILIISHFSLLLGCALPKWMSSGFSDRPLAPFAGILSLGIGDTMASVVGYKYGVLRWSKSGQKTIEGTAAGITSVLVACSVLLPLLASTGYMLSQHWLSLFLAVTVSGLLEAYTAQLDNAFIPLVFYSLLCL